MTVWFHLSQLIWLNPIRHYFVPLSWKKNLYNKYLMLLLAKPYVLCKSMTYHYYCVLKRYWAINCLTNSLKSCCSAILNWANYNLAILSVFRHRFSAIMSRALALLPLFTPFVQTQNTLWFKTSVVQSQFVKEYEFDYNIQPLWLCFKKCREMQDANVCQKEIHANQLTRKCEIGEILGIGPRTASDSNLTVLISSLRKTQIPNSILFLLR